MCGKAVLFMVYSALHSAKSALGLSLLEYSGQGKKILLNVYVSKKYEDKPKVNLLSLGMLLSFTF